MSGTGVTGVGCQERPDRIDHAGRLGGMLAVGGVDTNAIAVMYRDAAASYVVVDLVTGTTRRWMEGKERDVAAVRPDGAQRFTSVAPAQTIHIYDAVNSSQLGALHRHKTGVPNAQSYSLIHLMGSSRLSRQTPAR